MSDKDKIDELVNRYNQLKSEIAKVVVGQDDVIEQVCISVLSRAHCLLVSSISLCIQRNHRLDLDTFSL